MVENHTETNVQKQYYCIEEMRASSSRFLAVLCRYRRCIRLQHSVNVKSVKLKENLHLSNYFPEKIRNFCIVAHIDHGKSTLADRLLELTGTVSAGMGAQILDKLQVEKERGITVKAQTSSMFYEDSNGNSFLLNLIDTPGHVDFSYEVSRSLSACNGAVLLVDANQGVQAQTVANFWLAFEQELTLMPVLNKMDLKEAKPDLVKEQMEQLFEIRPEDCLLISAKTGMGVNEVLKGIVENIQPPVGSREAPFRALIFDSWFEHFRGAITLVLVKDGWIEKGQQVTSLNSGKSYDVQEVGIMYPDPVPVQKLFAGQVGYIVANMRTVQEANIGDTLSLKVESDRVKCLPGFKPIKPVVFAGLFPLEVSEYPSLRNAVEKLALNDPSVSLEPDHSPALGQGWRIGFLGLLHMEVFEQRLDQEHNAAVILTAPNVPYKAVVKDNPTIRKRYGGKGEIFIVDPAKFPEPPDVSEFQEPVVLATIISPQEYVGEMLSLCNNRRGRQHDMTVVEGGRILLRFELPLAEIIFDFFDRLKRMSSGYASFDYEMLGHRSADLVKLNIVINGRLIEEFSTIVLKSQAHQRGKETCKKLAEEIPRQQYEVVIAATLGNSNISGKPIAKEKIRAFRKDFTQKLKGNFGDPSRLKKLISHQKEGKARMKQIGQVQIPKNAFINVLKRD